MLSAARSPSSIAVARLIRCAPCPGASFVVGHRHRPALGQRRGDEEELELRERAWRQRPPAQRVRREAARRDGVDRALVRHHRADALGAALGGCDHRGHGRLGLAVHVGGPVKQLGGDELLRDQPEKGHLDVAAAQNGARRGVLEALRGVVERVVGWAAAGRTPRSIVLCGTEPIHSAPVAGATLPKSIRPVLLKKALRI